MSNPYERVNPGRLTFKDGTLASRSKSIDKKKKKKKKNKKQPSHNPEEETVITAAIDPEDENAIEAAAEAAGAEAQEGGEESAPYSIDAAKRMNYDELFPVEAKKFGYDPKLIKQKTTIEAALDDRVKKKADRYCK